MKHLYLIGMMGSGKTCIGKMAARKLHRRFADTDALVEKAAGMTVAEIFASLGEAGFRQWEAKVLADLETQRPMVIATGGGIVLSEQNIELMRRSGTVVWLKRDLHTVIQNPRIRLRPLLHDDETQIFRIAAEREPLYKKACHFVVYNDEDRMKTLHHVLRTVK